MSSTNEVNPRWRIWELSTGGGRPWEYIVWIGQRWREYGKQAYTDADHEKFDTWLRLGYGSTTPTLFSHPVVQPTHP